MYILQLSLYFLTYTMMVENCSILIFSKFIFQSSLNFQTENKKWKLCAVAVYKNWYFSLHTCSVESFYCCMHMYTYVF